MKKIFLLIITVCFLNANAEVHKGQTYYYYLLKDSLGYNGLIFAKQYSDKQWIQLFEHDAKELKNTLQKENKNLKTFLNSKKFDEIRPHLKAFVIKFASNKKNAPQCIE